MADTSYIARRGEIQTYFDRTAVEAWKRFATQAPLGRIRATVREGRARMRALMLSALPADLSGWRILDAGCGTGAMSLELTRRGADVVGIDLAPEIIRFAQETWPADHGTGSVDLPCRRHAVGRPSGSSTPSSRWTRSSTTSRPTPPPRSPRLPRARASRIVFTFAPRTPALAAMHTMGRLFPRSDRAPSIVPTRPEDIASRLAGKLAVGVGWLARRPHRARVARLLHVADDGARPAMMIGGKRLAKGWIKVGTRFLPFADAASEGLPLGRLIRLSLFQVTVGMAMVLLTGTLNRVMIVELGVPASVVAFMVALPIVFAPLRALVGHRSDTYRSFLGWRRVPFIWMGTMLQFGGFAIMPFALLVLTGQGATTVPYAGEIGAALAFLLVGAGLHTTQTAGLALACDLAPEQSRPRVVALLYVMLLVGMLISALVLSALLADFSHLRLIQVVQGAAVITMALNLIALWKQEGRNPATTSHDRARPSFKESWATISGSPRARAPADRGGARHGRLLDAGRAAGALWRPGAASGRRRHDRADGDDGGWHDLRPGACRACAWRAASTPAGWPPSACWSACPPSPS